MATAIYASILALLMCWLALNVIKARRKHSVRYGDGGVDALVIARTAHANAVDNIPIGLILLFLLEFNGAYLWLVHVAGVALVAGRVVHAWGIVTETHRGRFIGMHITFWTIVGLSILNLVVFGGMLTS